MRHPARAAAVALAAALACTEPAPSAPPQAPPPRPDAATAFTLRDLALATALDARLARLSLAAADLEAALARGGAGARERSRTLAAELEVAKGEVGRAASAVAHPKDRPLAARAAGLAAEYADRLLAAAREGSAPASAQAAAAREQLGGAIAGYRQARSGWRVDAPAPQGAEREFAEARREMERAESASVGRTRVAPREEGHELDPTAVRMTGRMAAERARAAAERLPAATKDAALRYAAAQEKVLAAVAALSAAPDPEKPEAARAYQAAKADALAALADHFATLAAR
jgi:hypothetical protein